MAAFPMCAACRKEYGDPLDRRFHAEPNACPACGPRLSVRDGDGAPVETDDPIGAAASAILGGSIVAVRGLGGFQLAADATNDGAVRALRVRKRREEKPFAVMFRDVGSVRAAARINAADEAILRSPPAPVLLAPARPRSPLAPSVSAGLPTAGVFLPYTPLHRMLLDRADRPLVMTSGNATDEPIAIGNDEAMSRLRGIADLFLLHDREVVQRSDDSVVRRVGRGIYPIRRARGFVPAPVTLAPLLPGRRGPGRRAEKHLLFRQGGRGVPVPAHRGPGAGVGARLLRGGVPLLPAVPRRPAARRVPRPAPRVFHHRVRRSRRCGPSLRPAAPQGAHLFRAGRNRVRREGRGGGVRRDRVRRGRRDLGRRVLRRRRDGSAPRGASRVLPPPRRGRRRPGTVADRPLPAPETIGAAEAETAARELFPGIPRDSVRLVLEALEKKINVAPTSSAGRLFDAVSAICGLCARSSYEGQAPMRLEGAAARDRRRHVSVHPRFSRRATHGRLERAGPGNGGGRPQTPPGGDDFPEVPRHAGGRDRRRGFAARGNRRARGTSYSPGACSRT